MSDNGTVEIGRIAMRIEGEFWMAYLAHSDTMENAMLLGSIRLALIEDPENRRAFLATLQQLLSTQISELFHQKPRWDGPRKPPEHERRKH